MKVKTFVIAAAGEGKRLRPISEFFPKEMFPINKKPVIHHLIDEIRKQGGEKIYIVISKKKEIIRKYIEKAFNDKTISFIYQSNPEGLINLINKVPLKNEPFGLLLGDEIIDYKNSWLELVNVFAKTGKTSILLKKVPNRDKHKYGMVNTKRNFINNYIEKPTSHFSKWKYAIIGRYIFSKNDLVKLQTIYKNDKDFSRLFNSLRSKSLVGIVCKNNRFDISTNEGLADIYKHIKKRDSF